MILCPAALVKCALRTAGSWIKLLHVCVSLHLPYMVKHKVLLDKRRSHSWTLLLVMGSWYQVSVLVCGLYQPTLQLSRAVSCYEDLNTTFGYKDTVPNHGNNFWTDSRVFFGDRTNWGPHWASRALLTILVQISELQYSSVWLEGRTISFCATCCLHRSPVPRHWLNWWLFSKSTLRRREWLLQSISNLTAGSRQLEKVSYKAKLRYLATYCDFGEYLDQALRDRLACRLKSEAM